MELSSSRSHFTALYRSKCSVNQMQFILGIVCHLGGVILYVALIMDCQGKTIKKGFNATFIFSESVGEGFVSISFTNS